MIKLVGPNQLLPLFFLYSKFVMNLSKIKMCQVGSKSPFCIFLMWSNQCLQPPWLCTPRSHWLLHGWTGQPPLHDSLVSVGWHPPVQHKPANTTPGSKQLEYLSISLFLFLSLSFFLFVISLNWSMAHYGMYSENQSYRVRLDPFASIYSQYWYFTFRNSLKIISNYKKGLHDLELKDL